MPSYCDSTPTVNSVPDPNNMTMFKPYFVIPSGAQSFTVHIKVPSNCYFVDSDEPGYPSGGRCGEPNDLHCVIKLKQTPDCSNTDPTVLLHPLEYAEDPNGEHINIYVEDLSNGGRINGNSRSTKKAS